MGAFTSMVGRAKKRLPLTKTNILKYVSDEDLLNRYVMEFKGFNRQIHSNIRTNDSKSKSLSFICKGQKAIISDFGTQYIGLNVWNYLMIYLGYPDNRHGYMSLLDLIRRDFNLPLQRYQKAQNVAVKREFRPAIANNKPMEESNSWDIRYRSREMGSWPIDKEFWTDQYGITFETLELFNVKALDHFSLVQPDVEIMFSAGYKNPRYVYVPHPSTGITGWKRKIYTPYAGLHGQDKEKWFNSLPKNTVLGLHTLPEKGKILIIETSLKDTMANYELFKDNDDVSFIDVFSESVFLPDDVFEDLKSRFEVIIYHGDNDEPGIRQAKLFSERYKIPYFTNPNDNPDLKDSADMIKALGQEKARNFITTTINTIIGYEI